MRKRKIDEWHRVCLKLTNDSVRIKIPRAFLSTLTLFFHHVSDAMGGDDRPDHGLAMMRRSREYYRKPFYFLYGKLKRAEEKMNESERRKTEQLFNRFHELLKNRERPFLMKKKKHGKKKYF